MKHVVLTLDIVTEVVLLGKYYRNVATPFDWRSDYLTQIGARLLTSGTHAAEK